jgi:hypothetical protein
LSSRQALQRRRPKIPSKHGRGRGLPRSAVANENQDEFRRGHAGPLLNRVEVDDAFRFVLLKMSIQDASAIDAAVKKIGRVQVMVDRCLW